MNSLSRISMMLMCTVFVLAMAEAQTTKKETTESDKHENLGQRIGSIVEDVIDKLEKELSGRADVPVLKKDALKRVHETRSSGDSP
jgi:hypothetical protein